MEAKTVFILCSVLAAAVNAERLEISWVREPPSLRIPVSHNATIQCCWKCRTNMTLNWTRTIMMLNTNSSVININMSDARVKVLGDAFKPNDVKCSSLVLENVSVSDIGLYRCYLHDKTLLHPLHTPGTFLQVFVPIRKTLDISERAKNSIITAEGVLLLLCLLVPGTMLICKSKGLHELERRKGKEEENIYEGLNLDDCTSTYHQIQRSQVQGPYHDVVNAMEEDIQLEKP